MKRFENEKSDITTESAGCIKDTDCKGDRICVKGECQWPEKK
ncbi:MAG: hypothetical protein ACP5QK_12965 [Myxococcota bacterium]